MTEVAFCKSFLSALDARPIKLSSDHIADARQYPAQGAYTLPRLPHPPHPSRPTVSSSITSTSTTITVTLKPLKPSTPAVPIPNIDAGKTSIYDLKAAYASATTIPAPKIKVLWKKKPVPDSKTVAEVIGGEAGGEIEFGVMVLGGPTAIASSSGTSPVASPPAAQVPTKAEKGLAETEASPPVAVGPSGKEIVATEEFWGDLRTFVLQRIKDEHEAERLVSLFRAVWNQDQQ